MTADEFRAALKELGVTQRWLADRLDLLPETVSTWATGRNPVPAYATYVLTLLEQLPRERWRSKSTPQGGHKHIESEQ